MIVHDDIKQGSEAWEQIRLGRATASQASNILTPTGKQFKAAEHYVFSQTTKF